MHYVIGVDGGASKAHALLLDETGRTLGFGQGGSCNHQTCGLEQALQEIRRAVLQAVGEAGLSPQSVDLGCFCLAGADLPEDYAMLQAAVEGLSLVERVLIKNDTLAALRAGLTRPWGVAVICGSGFNAAGRAQDGREVVLPGLGPISGDWGGGGELSMEVIRAVMRAWDGRGQPTQLTRIVLNAFQLPSEEVLLSRLYHEQISWSEITRLSPLLFEAGEAGDPVAREIIIRMGTEVGVTANALLRRLSLLETDAEVGLGGSVFKGRGPLLIETAAQVIHSAAPLARLKPLQVEPVVGAALLALEAVGVEVTPDLSARIFDGLPPRLHVRRV